MNRASAWFLFTAGLVVLLAARSAVHTQEPPLADNSPVAEEQNRGVEVLARGPVHEAYATSAQPAPPKPTAIVPREPPPPIEELPPEQKPDGANVQWIPGYWSYDEERGDFIWISGFWRVPPPGRQWVPGHWNRVEGGWQWVPGFWNRLDRSDITYLPPPPEPVTLAPSVPAPSPEHVYIPGCWVYRDNRYFWRPGFWHICRPGWVWVPAHYIWTPCGYVFIDGYWDYPLRERGLLFAPAIIDLSICSQPGWYYTPRYVIADDCLVTALFVRPGCSHYFFGDYYEPCYRRSGFVAWCDFSIGGWRDPLFSYYQVSYRSRAGWEIGLRATYAGRYSGELARPPRTLVQQNTIVNNVTINKTVVNNTIINNGNQTINKNSHNVRNTTMLTALNQVDPNTIKLKPVAPEVRQAERATAQQLVKAAQQRALTEKQILTEGAPPRKPTDAPRVARLEVPRPTTVRTMPNKQPPPDNSDMKPARASSLPSEGDKAKVRADEGPVPKPTRTRNTVPTDPAPARVRPTDPMKAVQRQPSQKAPAEIPTPPPVKPSPPVPMPPSPIIHKPPGQAPKVDQPKAAPPMPRPKPSRTDGKEPPGDLGRSERSPREKR